MLNRFSYIFLLLGLALLGFVYISFTRDRGTSSPQYTGVELCRSCHQSLSSGRQYQIWRLGPHAGAYEALEGDSARMYLSRTRKDVSTCLPCHTAIGRESKNDAEKAINSEGIGCERCHGPGSDYSYYNVMLDREEFLSEGGVAGSLDDCYSCHSRNPAIDTTHCPFQYDLFNADSAWRLIQHPIPDSVARRDTLIDPTQ